MHLLRQLWRLHFSPAAELRSRIATDPRRWVLAIAALEGLGAFAGRIGSNYEAPPGIAAAVALGLVPLAPLLGLLGLYLHGACLWLVGVPFRGRANGAELRAALAWGSVPLLLPLTAALPVELMRWRHRLELESTFELMLTDTLRPLIGYWVALGAFISVFTISSCVGEAQGFGKARAFSNEVLAALLPFVLGGAALVLGHLL